MRLGRDEEMEPFNLILNDFIFIVYYLFYSSKPFLSKRSITRATYESHIYNFKFVTVTLKKETGKIYLNNAYYLT